MHVGLSLLCLTTLATAALGGEPAGSPGNDQKALDAAVTRGVAYLKTRGQASDGSFSRTKGIGITALATTALLRNGATADDPAVSRALKFLESFAQQDGGLYQKGSLYRNYETCLAIMCLVEANQDGRYDQRIQRARGFVKGIQWDESEGHDKSDLSFGGAGYGKHKRPDLSNTSFLIDALKTADNDEDAEAIARALVFVSRCQNLESEHNRTQFATKDPDGGFYYTCAAGGTSQAGQADNGALRSYGSMTYAGLKSLIYAGLAPDDPRVTAAKKWLAKNYNVKTNPGMGDSGLYYYYHTCAKTLSAAGMKSVTTPDGKKHNWRSELVSELARRQAGDGSWTNENARWLEDDPNLVTAYALLALSYCRE